MSQVPNSASDGSSGKAPAAARSDEAQPQKDMPPGAAAKAVEDAGPRAWYPLVLIFVGVALGIFAGGLLSYRNY